MVRCQPQRPCYAPLRQDCPNSRWLRTTWNQGAILLLCWPILVEMKLIYSDL